MRAAGCVKKAAAQTNGAAGRLPPKVADAIAEAADDVISLKLLDQFVVDAFQSGAGVSFHMNVNEVIANRAIEILGGRRGDYALVHPNDHVNLGQSTNDVVPTAMRLAALMLLREAEPVFREAVRALRAKAEEFKGIVKAGRTHMMDAVPLTLGQEFGGYASAIERAAHAVRESALHLRALGIGASAVGTGVNTFSGYREEVVRRLRDLTALELEPAPDLFEATQSLAPFAILSGALKALALECIRVGNDFRLLSSGPVTGLGEIRLPALQPGSSIMPGKVNPVMPEMLAMVGFQVVGNDAAISLAVQAGQLELNVMMPLVAHNLLQSLQILPNAIGGVHREMRRGRRRRRGALPPLRREHARAGHDPRHGLRLSEGRRDRQALARGRQVHPRNGARAGLRHARAGRKAPVPRSADPPRERTPRAVKNSSITTTRVFTATKGRALREDRYGNSLFLVFVI